VYRNDTKGTTSDANEWHIWHERHNEWISECVTPHEWVIQINTGLFV
jgi:hypothetical protein